MLLPSSLAVFGTLGLVGVSAAALVQHRGHRLRVSRHQVAWCTSRQPIRVVHLTDLHIGITTPSRLLRRVAELVHEHEPDLVVLTGDYLNTSLDHLPKLEAFVRTLPRPCVATLGNHDHWSGAESIVQSLEAADVCVLRNEHTIISGLHFELTVVGVDDGHTKRADVRRAFHRIDKPNETLALCHSPVTAREIARAGGRLVLAGHTHAGQIHIPRVTPRLARAVGQPYLAGWYEVGEAMLYVNAGLGHAPYRLGKCTMPELAIFELTPSPNGV